MIKSGFKTSEFWLNVTAGAVCGGAYALGHPLDNAAVFGIFAIAGAYTWHRYKLKESAIHAWQWAKDIDPNYDQHIIEVVNTIATALKANGLEKEIIDQVVSAELNKLK